jgi:hypothetical protein
MGKVRPGDRTPDTPYRFRGVFFGNVPDTAALAQLRLRVRILTANFPVIALG